tara:strand:- start:917 stop:1174 length:258 start_codon:yes stop_codon:yes gene_type:complete
MARKKQTVEQVAEVIKPPELLKLEKKLRINCLKSNLTRARSLVVGTQFNGCYEVGLRSDDGTYYYVVVTPQDVPAIKKMFVFLDE